MAHMTVVVSVPTYGRCTPEELEVRLWTALLDNGLRDNDLLTVTLGDGPVCVAVAGEPPELDVGGLRELAAVEAQAAIAQRKPRR